MLISVVTTATPASAILYGKAQIQGTSEEQIVELAGRADAQVKNLIELMYANETALKQIEDFGLIDELNGNLTLYDEGVANLEQAHEALESANYDAAVDIATEALRIFREIFKSINIILEEAGLQKGQLVDAQGLLEAITRGIRIIDRLRDILPADATAALDLLDQAEAYLDLNAARALLIEGENNSVADRLNQANQLISQVYQYFKSQAEESNTLRIDDYCERVQERIRERFRYGRDYGIDFSTVLSNLGYQSENQFIETLQDMIQTAQGKTGDFKSAMQDLDAISRVVQEIDQALEQEINQYQNRYGTENSSGGNGSGNIGKGYGPVGDGNMP